jgi:hypothetical protein
MTQGEKRQANIFKQKKYHFCVTRLAAERLDHKSRKEKKGATIKSDRIAAPWRDPFTRGIDTLDRRRPDAIAGFLVRPMRD